MQIQHFAIEGQSGDAIILELDENLDNNVYNEIPPIPHVEPAVKVMTTGNVADNSQQADAEETEDVRSSTRKPVVEIIPSNKEAVGIQQTD